MYVRLGKRKLDVDQDPAREIHCATTGHAIGLIYCIVWAFIPSRA